MLKGVVLIYFVGQCFIFVAYFVFLVSRLKNNKGSLLLTDTLSRIFSLFGYMLLHSLNSIEHTIFGILRNFIGGRLSSKKFQSKIVIFLFLLLLLLGMYSMSFHGVSTVLFMLSGVINLVAVIFFDVTGIRVGTFLAALCNIFAFSRIHSYASIIGETLCALLCLVNLIRKEGNKDVKEDTGDF